MPKIGGMKMQINVTRKELLHAGKANNVYKTDNPMYLELEASDRISAGNGEKKDVITGKGIANNRISEAIFQQLEDYGVPTHYVCHGSNEASKIVKAAKPIPLEVIGRFKAVGSYVKRYNAEPMKPFDEMYIEYTYKSDEAGDPPISEAAIIAEKILTKRELGYVEYITERVGEFIYSFFGKCGGELIDFKIEFGFLPDARLIVIDEISPDTCRILDRETGKSLDKDLFRQNLGGVAESYMELARRVSDMEE